MMASMQQKYLGMKLNWAVRSLALAAICAAGLAGQVVWAADTSAAQQLQRWQAEAGAPANAGRGKAFFVARHGSDLSCASCHGEVPTADARHASTGKTIAPLAPAFNAERFTDTAKVDKWFRRNCRDVLGRECSAVEKADVMAFLVGIKR
jgi:Domain of unknown function (DUF1924)